MWPEARSAMACSRKMYQAARAGLSLVRHRSLPPGDDTDGEGLTVSLWLLSLPRDPAPVRSAASKRKETLA